VQTVQQRARRGSILAADGRPLAKDEDSYDLTVDYRNCPRSPAFWLDVSAATGVSATELEEAAAAGAKRRVWAGAVAASERDRLDEVCADWHADGVSAAWAGRRDYPLAEAASSLVGVIRPKGLAIGSDDYRYKKMVDREGKPKDGVFIRDLLTGVEAAEDERLTGQSGLAEGLTDRYGAFMASRGFHTIREKADGKDVRLTIVPELQVAATTAIRKQVELRHAQSGVALVMDPKTGSLLAMANWPAAAPYRPDGTENPLKAGGGGNPCYMSVLEPGSMFKVLTLAKCLDVAPGVARGGVMCTSHWKVIPKAKAIGCDEGHAHGLVDDRLAIAKSCNIAAGHWALAIGHDAFLQYLEDAGLRYRSKLGLPGESAALFPGKDYSPTLQTAVVGFGQSINCTPVQLIGAFGAVANGGVRMEPRVIDEVGDVERPVEPGRRLFSESAAQETLRAMEAVMSPIGTGRKLLIPGYRLAGKTGTAQKLGRRQHGHVSNFIGMLPAGSPKYVVMTMVNEPQGPVYHGSDVAGPAFREIALALIRYGRLAPTEPIPVKTK
jgi:cell division protein FtsI/penicillin-binding protein 2